MHEVKREHLKFPGHTRLMSASRLYSSIRSFMYHKQQLIIKDLRYLQERICCTTEFQGLIHLFQGIVQFQFHLLDCIHIFAPIGVRSVLHFRTIFLFKFLLCLMHISLSYTHHGKLIRCGRSPSYPLL